MEPIYGPKIKTKPEGNDFTRTELIVVENGIEQDMVLINTIIFITLPIITETGLGKTYLLVCLIQNVYISFLILPTKGIFLFTYKRKEESYYESLLICRIPFSPQIYKLAQYLKINQLSLVDP